MERGFERITLPCDLGKVEAGGKVRAFAGEDDGANILRQAGEERLEPQHGRIVERVALLRAGKAQMGDCPEPRRLERLRQIDVNRLIHLKRRHGSLSRLSCAWRRRDAA